MGLRLGLGWEGCCCVGLRLGQTLGLGLRRRPGLRLGPGLALGSGRRLGSGRLATGLKWSRLGGWVWG